jgi:hypothetical protein
MTIKQMRSAPLLQRSAARAVLPNPIARSLGFFVDSSFQLGTGAMQNVRNLEWVVVVKRKSTVSDPPMHWNIEEK